MTGGTSGADVVVAYLTPGQAQALYELACWRLDPDCDHGDVWESVEHLAGAASALITGGAKGERYV